MAGRKYDIAIAGGGLAGGLIALALQRQRPDLSVVLVEQGEALGGNHRWSWFASDLDPEGEALLAGIRLTTWEQGYDVRFPAYRRHLSTPYRSLASEDFDAALHRELPKEAIRLRAEIASLDAQGVTLTSGEVLSARTVIDCRGFGPSEHLTGGWQVFMGRHLRTPAPHHVTRPWIMDAAVGQHGAYRFVYVLPLGAQDLFVEDTYYADSPRLDRRSLSSRIDAYCSAMGWTGEILGGETGVLPVVTGGNFARFQQEQAIEGVAVAGTRGGFFHPLTSYSLPFAVQTALAVVAEADLPGPQLAAVLQARAQEHWKATKFYRRLGKMLFGAAAPDKRYRVLERFYRLPRPLVERFYSGNTTFSDRSRVLCGKPPVGPLAAMRALLARGAPLAQRQEQ